MLIIRNFNKTSLTISKYTFKDLIPSAWCLSFQFCKYFLRSDPHIDFLFRWWRKLRLPCGEKGIPIFFSSSSSKNLSVILAETWETFKKVYKLWLSLQLWCIFKMTNEVEFTQKKGENVKMSATYTWLIIYLRKNNSTYLPDCHNRVSRRQ